MDYIALAIPVFVALIAIEWVVLRVTGRRHFYRFADSVANVGTGIIQQVSGIFFKVVVVGMYFALHARAAAWEIPLDSVLAWCVCFVLVDFLYYWFHRISHEMNALWAAHVVHHQSEEFNLSVALRQSAFQPLCSAFFYLPLALIGFPPVMFVAISSFDTLYQFWIHTRTIGRLGPFEHVFVTPSHHRVHHGSNPKYLDRNHGGTFIIWDKMFGTFQEEEEEPDYGVTLPLSSWNPIWANFHTWKNLVHQARGIDSWMDRIRVFTKPPGWEPGGVVPPTGVIPPKYAAGPGASTNLYVGIHFTTAFLVSVWLIYQGRVDWESAGLLGVVLWTLADCSGLLDGRRWTLLAEWARLGVLAAAGVVTVFGAVHVGHAVSLGDEGVPALLLVALALLSAPWLWRMGKTLGSGSAETVFAP